ncbi:hypothetical protein PWT90_11229 [Aphanocladium album]|nr:hypothetical protein PWT90_11229 [Aphanocladium album]
MLSGGATMSPEWVAAKPMKHAVLTYAARVERDWVSGARKHPVTHLLEWDGEGHMAPGDVEDPEARSWEITAKLNMRTKELEGVDGI